ncbi:T9SS type A sorting domain-containing protein [Hymenobacter sp. NST-14]|uniref:T9SS type A sorting domain-containing protein n=1 Tax=Hymenobacter piscis TaxID=2839984 RepID=UPI001C02206B|nr:T9SS type A sorting domain-containing protein [Hymenobacter piscis]MBT9394018.1 T9SS type A sorting domain-containing protein [Hymenobacter piscis]
MRHRYALLTSLLLTGAYAATGQDWRPFRANGDVHAFTLQRAAAMTDTVLTLRLDSAGVRGADSVYFFNRVMRPAAGPGERWRKSRNNQFGAHLRYEAATRVYWLEWAAEAGAPARSVPLPVFQKTGTTFTGSTGPTATVVSRATRLLDGQPDSVVTLRAGAETYEVSKSYGLVAGPGGAGANLTLARQPAAAGQSYYNPLLVADFRPGDEFGYYGETAIYPNTLVCETTHLLQRVVSRQETPDSLILVVRYQVRTQASGAPGCPPAGVRWSVPTTARLAASRRTGQWAPGSGGAVGPAPEVPLLAYEWAATGGPAGSVRMGHPVVAGRQSSGGCGATVPLRTQTLWPARTGSSDTYLPYALDQPPVNELLGSGTGVVQNQQLELVYFRRSNGVTTLSCGTRQPFDLLLSAPGSQAAGGARLYPNPAAATTTLELPAPTGAAGRLVLLTATGQTLRTRLLPVGTARLAVELAGLPAGLYLVRVEQPGRPAVLLRLHHAE